MRIIAPSLYPTLTGTAGSQSSSFLVGPKGNLCKYERERECVNSGLARTINVSNMFSFVEVLCRDGNKKGVVLGCVKKLTSNRITCGHQCALQHSINKITSFCCMIHDKSFISGLDPFDGYLFTSEKILKTWNLINLMVRKFRRVLTFLREVHIRSGMELSLPRPRGASP